MTVDWKNLLLLGAETPNWLFNAVSGPENIYSQSTKTTQQVAFIYLHTHTHTRVQMYMYVCKP